jgi:hypothetical protein
MDVEAMRRDFEARELQRLRGEVLEALGDGVERSGSQVEGLVRARRATVREVLRGLVDDGALSARGGPRRAILYSLPG